MDGIRWLTMSCDSLRLKAPTCTITWSSLQRHAHTRQQKKLSHTRIFLTCLSHCQTETVYKDGQTSTTTAAGTGQMNLVRHYSTAAAASPDRLHTDSESRKEVTWSYILLLSFHRPKMWEKNCTFYQKALVDVTAHSHTTTTTTITSFDSSAELRLVISGCWWLCAAYTSQFGNTIQRASFPSHCSEVSQNVTRGWVFLGFSLCRTGKRLCYVSGATFPAISS